MKKGDFVIIGAVLAAVLLSTALFFVRSSAGTTVTVKENNETVYRGALTEDKIIKLSGNTVEIKDGRVQMVDADCKNQLCVNHRAISEKGESIVCLPNRVLVEIE